MALMLYWYVFRTYCTYYRLKEFYVVDFRNLSSGQSLATVHGAVLALTASVLSAPYDMPRYVCLFLKACFVIYLGQPSLLIDIVSILLV